MTVNFTTWKGITDGQRYEIPDVGLDHQWYAPEISDVSTYPDVEGDLDMSAEGDPSLGDINGNQAVDYGGDPDAHSVDSALSFGDGDVWTAVAVVTKPTQQARFLSSGDGNGFSIGTSNGGYQIEHIGRDAVAGGDVIDEAQVIVATHDGGEVILDANKSEQINTEITSPNSPTNETAIGKRSGEDDLYHNALHGAAGYEPAFADQERRDELANEFASAFGISLD